MNFVKLSNNAIQTKSIGNDYCERYLQNKKCHNFLVNKQFLDGTHTCPHGFSCVVKNGLICCGLLINNKCKLKKIMGHIHNSSLPKQTMKLISENDTWKVISFMELYNTFFIRSQAKHEIANFVGQLKSLLEIFNPCDDFETILSEEFKQLANIFDAFVDNSSIYYDFIREVVKAENGFSLIHGDKHNLETFESLNSLYSNMLDDIYQKAKAIKEMLGNNYDYESQYGNNKQLLSLIFLNDLFLCRIDYHYYVLSNDNEDEQFKKRISYNWNKLATKYSKIMEYSAKKKNTRFVFSGTTYDNFEAYGDLYLVVYVIFENAIKYTKMGDAIKVAFTKNDVYSTLTVKNTCDYISKKTKDVLCQRGYCGENSSRVNSSGLGLYFVNQILERNKMQFEIDIDDNGFEYSISIHAPVR